MAKDWTDFLKPIIPEHRLADVLHVAFEGKASSYLLSAHDMRNAWFKLTEQEGAERERARLMEPKGLKEIRCRRCLDSGAELIYNDFGKKLGARPGCRHRPLQPGEWLYKEEQRLDELTARLYPAQEKAAA